MNITRVKVREPMSFIGLLPEAEIIEIQLYHQSMGDNSRSQEPGAQHIIYLGAH